MTDHQDVIAAFVDNEPVGAEDLAEALVADEGRAYLIDLLVLRGLVGDGLVRHREYVAPGLQPRGLPGRPKYQGFWLTAAAALLVAGVTGGFFAGRRTLDGGSALVPSPAPIVTPAGSSTSPAPAPTHVIRMEKGVDWNERSGGN